MKFLACAALLIFSGCATTAPQTQAILRTPPNAPVAAIVSDVPFLDQTAGHCGPATLTMAMQWAGHKTTVDEMSPKVMTPLHSGSLQQDLMSASRREGLLAVRIDGMEALIKEIAAGHPVIIFENLGLTWYQQWHYALVFGYNLGKEELIMHSGHEAAEHVDMRIFERSWKLSDYWGLVILQPGELSAAANELANMQAAAGLEQADRNDEAEHAYHGVLKRWPESLGGLMGLSNIAFKRKDFQASIDFLEQAQKTHPDSPALLHNLKVARAALLKN
jgi:tetratricopeptide (TPR) repeat protein